MGETEQPLNCSNSGIQPGDQEDLPPWKREVPTFRIYEILLSRESCFFSLLSIALKFILQKILSFPYSWATSEVSFEELGPLGDFSAFSSCFLLVDYQGPPGLF